MSDVAAPPVSTTPSLTFGFVKLVVRDLPAMADFYARALGLHVDQTMDNETMTEQVLRKPGVNHGATIILYRHKDGREVTVGNGHGPIGFYVRDVDAAFDYAVGQGAAALTPPTDAGAVRYAFVLDPEGHEIEFVALRS